MIESVSLFDPVKIAEYLTINELNLEDELATCARYYYLYADLATDAERAYNEAVMILEQYEATVSKTIKIRLLSEGNKREKITETEIKRCYREDDRWKELKIQELEAEIRFKKLEKAMKAFEMKNQSCMSLNKRQLFKASKGMIGADEL
jgi:hypothetical protein